MPMLRANHSRLRNVRQARSPLGHVRHARGGVVVTAGAGVGAGVAEIVGALATRPRSKFDSKQDWRTPPEFIAAVEHRFGPIMIDLAASDGDECKPLVAHITPDEDSLAMSWPTARHNAGVYWLNPPFSEIAPWAKKCAAWCEVAAPGVVLAFLVPASVDAEWWQESVRGRAIVFALKSRIRFIGAKDGYPKPLALCVFDPRYPRTPSSVHLWDWKNEVSR
jgi:DNA (cytosine-5)-methyltransferase 1